MPLAVGNRDTGQDGAAHPYAPLAHAAFLKEKASVAKKRTELVGGDAGHRDPVREGKLAALGQKGAPCAAGGSQPLAPLPLGSG